MRIRKLGLVASLGCALAWAMGPAAAGASFTEGPIIAVNANQSNNWSGYNQGALEPGKGPFTQISADWSVPTATQHTANRAESSSVWVGIGGGCLETSCTATDNTLIQAGTEQDVSKSGTASYSAWWEIIPGPSITITNMAVHAGDAMHVDIREVVPLSNVWTITVKNVTRNQTFTQTVPYSSTHGTAEWIVETPLLIGTSGTGFSAMPNLSGAGFSNATVNNAAAGLVVAEEMQLVDTSGNAIATPSAPSGGTAFSVCTYSSSC
ncbi:MAG TPA: G1 family glutamic endopeptidase [Acidimicrobiales bacterium]|nr:G1 family glutamic endopeptidase [Acidimicrobiales bacterium]